MLILSFLSDLLTAFLRADGGVCFVHLDLV